MNLYSITIKIAATAYIKAEDEKTAMAIAHSLHYRSPLIEDSDGDVLISGRAYTDPALPHVSLSPAMTIHGPWDEYAELAQADIPISAEDGQ